MRSRDSILFALPLASIAIMLVFAVFLYHQFAEFEQSFSDDARANLAEQSKLAVYVLGPLLNEGKIQEAVDFCHEFGNAKVRLSLIDLKGKVLADSLANTEKLSNHLSRPEVQNALDGKDGDALRYSSSLSRWMMYHAVKMQTANGDYILRIALSTDTVSRSIDKARAIMILALICGCWFVSPLFFYIYKSIRTPLRRLLKSMEQIAAGKLNTEIAIPEDGVIRDIALSASSMTAQLRAQLSRTTADKDEQEAILNTMTEAVLLIDEEDNAVRNNQAALTLFDLGDIHNPFQISQCGMPELQREVQQCFEQGGSFEKEMILSRSGEKKILFVKGLLLSDDFSKKVLLTATDLTNLRQLESFRSDFIANVSHEIKTPLTGIVGAAEILEEGNISESQRQRMFGILIAQASRLNALVQDILSLAALERKQSASQREFAPVDLDAMLNTAVNLCRDRAMQSKVELNIVRNEPIRTDGDCQLLEQAVINVINNALNYSGSFKIDISLSRNENDAVISIQDWGVGIAAEHQPRIFERFYRVHKERSRELGGTGLGLAIVKHICQLHHGRAELESTPGAGCTFRLILPV